MVKFRRSGGGLSENLEDRRAAGGFGGMGRGARVGAGGGMVGIIGLLLAIFLGGGIGGGGGGGDLSDIFGQMQMGGSPGGTVDPADDELVQFMSDALDDIQAFWSTSSGLGSQYVDADLVLFSGGVQTNGCGSAPSSVGPFYCPADSKTYIDLDFFRDLEGRFGAPGDFAQVYVLAHELGHHVQNVVGTSDAVRQQQAADPGRANDLSVRLELQADCYAGVWGSSARDRGILEPGDVEEGLGAAAAVGDDRIQESAGAEIEPESWTHGSSEQRQRWFMQGFESGDHRTCDTFRATQL